MNDAFIDLVGKTRHGILHTLPPPPLSPRTTPLSALKRSIHLYVREAITTQFFCHFAELKEKESI